MLLTVILWYTCFTMMVSLVLRLIRLDRYGSMTGVLGLTMSASGPRKITGLDGVLLLFTLVTRLVQPPFIVTTPSGRTGVRS